MTNKNLFIFLTLILSTSTLVYENGFARGGRAFHGGGGFHGGIHHFNMQHIHNESFHPQEFHSNDFHPQEFHSKEFHPQEFHPQQFHAPQQAEHLQPIQNQNLHVDQQRFNNFQHKDFRMNPHPGIPNNQWMHPAVNHPNVNNVAKNSWHAWHNNWYGNYNNWWHGPWHYNHWYSGFFYGSLYLSLIPFYGMTYFPYYSIPFFEDNYLPFYTTTFNVNNTNTYVTQTTQPSPSANTQSNQPTEEATTLPANETWMASQSGEVPANAVVNTNDNGQTTYYCRAEYEETYYGVLVPKDGCYVENNSVTMRFDQYQVLVTQ